MIPTFDERGLLPPGDHEATFDGFRSSVLVVGPTDSEIPDWDAPWRQYLVDQAEVLVRQLWQVGVTEVFLK